MNIPDSLPLLFHDAHQDSSPFSGLNATPASAATVSTPIEDTSIGQHCLFAETSNPKSDNDNKELNTLVKEMVHSSLAEFRISPWTKIWL
jgi:hypothetical protein